VNVNQISTLVVVVVVGWVMMVSVVVGALLKKKGRILKQTRLGWGGVRHTHTRVTRAQNWTLSRCAW
jgi:hypothetical protein